MYATKTEKMKAMAEALTEIGSTMFALADASEVPPTAVNWCELSAQKLRSIANEFERLADSYTVDMARF